MHAASCLLVRNWQSSNVQGPMMNTPTCIPVESISLCLHHQYVISYKFAPNQMFVKAMSTDAWLIYRAIQRKGKFASYIVYNYGWFI
jgi:hypothetical protein